MTKLSLLIATVLILLSFCNLPYGSPVGEKPTFTDCRPHIDATIRNLAAKAVNAGEEPTEPQSADYALNEDSGESLPEIPDEVETPEIHQETKHDSHKEEKHHHDYEEEKSKAKTEHSKPSQREKEVERNEKKSAPKTGKNAKSKSKGGVFNAIIEFIFGASDGKRDIKYASPWQTHHEFSREIAVELKKAAAVAKSKQEPGMMSRLTNQLIYTIFGLSDSKRTSKWAKPWATHKEFIRVPKSRSKVESKIKPWEDKGIFSFSFLNSFIEMVFTTSSGIRDTKFAQPWSTHKEFQRFYKGEEKSEKPVKPKVLHSVPEKGGILNGMISLVFEVPDGARDPKWKDPWQGHPEFNRSEQGDKKVGQVFRNSIESGMIGGIFNKFVLLIFECPSVGRSSKWKEPWQTHAEFVRVSKEDRQKIVEVQDHKPGIISRSINSFIELLFGNSDGHRDPKFAKPWQTHKEFTGPSKRHKKRHAHHKSSSTKSTTEPKPVEHIRQYVNEEAKPHKQHQKKEHYHVDEEQKPHVEPKTTVQPQRKEEHQPKVEAKPEKVAEKPTFHPTPKDVHPPAPAKTTPKPVVDIPKEPERPVLEKVAEPKKERKERVIEDDEQILVVPSHVRSRDHIGSILGLDKMTSQSSSKREQASQSILKDLKGIYENAVTPLEKTYKYQDISNRHLSDAELYGPSVVLMLGPYSTGKSSFINYLLGTEFTKRGLKTGTPPSHGVFRIIQYGDHDRDLDGTDVSGQWLFSSLQKFGQNFVDQIKGKTLNIPLLKKVTFVEAPGVLEMRRPNERLYPFNDVLQWFIDRSDLIVVMFDYTKLDAGYEMEAILDQLKGREAQTRILLNKADQVPPEELIKVQGSLFWNLSPLLGVNTPPIVYAGSYASFPYQPASPIKLFEAQEETLLHDLASAFKARVNNRIAIVRRHAVRVRNHAQMVDTYLNTFYKNKGFLTSKHKLAEDIIESPHDYNIYEGLTLHTNVSRYDLPDAEVYRDFFRLHNLYDFQTLRQTCTYVGGCPLEKIDAAINKQLPDLIKKYRKLLEAGESGSHSPPSFNPEESSHARAHARTGKL